MKNQNKKESIWEEREFSLSATNYQCVEVIGKKGFEIRFKISECPELLDFFRSHLQSIIKELEGKKVKKQPSGIYMNKDIIYGGKALKEAKERNKTLTEAIEIIKKRI